MDVIALKNTEFPQDFMVHLDHDKCVALLNHLVSEPIKKSKVRVRQMPVTLRDNHVSFDFHLEVIGGQSDGLTIIEPFQIRDQMDLKAWLQQMSCLGCKVWDWGHGNPLTFLEGWDVAAAALVDSMLVAFQIPDGFILFCSENVLYTAICNECGKVSPDMWTSQELTKWLDDMEWIAFPDGEQVLHYCRKCVKKIIKF